MIKHNNPDILGNATVKESRLMTEHFGYLKKAAAEGRLITAGGVFSAELKEFSVALEPCILYRRM